MYGFITSWFNKIGLHRTHNTVIEDKCTCIAIRDVILEMLLIICPLPLITKFWLNQCA